MANWGHAFENDPKLRRFVLPRVHPTGRELGKGSYGRVEEIEVNGLVYAGKQLHEALVEQENADVEKIVSKYLEECQMMADMRHPHIVQFLGLCYLEGSALPVLVMERLDRSLDNLLETSPSIPLTLKRSLLTDVAQGLLYLHTHHPLIVHRDLSARNVLLTSSLVAKISDLGNARIINLRPGQQATTLSSIPGTMSYMPPESLHEPSRYGPRLDIFSFGHLALFTLTQVFPGNLLPATYTDPDGHLLARSEVERRTTYIQLLYGQLGEQHPLSQLVCQCLHNTPVQRPSAEELLQRLEELRPQGGYGSLKIQMTKLQVAMMSVLRMKTEEDEETLQVKVDPIVLQLQQKDHQLELKDDQLKQRDVELQQKDDQLMRTDVELQHRGDQLQQKDNQLKQKDDQLQQKDVELQQKDVELQQKDVELQQKDDQLMQKNVQLQQKDDQLEQKDVELQQTEDQIQQKEDQIQQKEYQLRDKDAQVQETNAQLIRQQKELKLLMEDRGRLQAEVEVKAAEFDRLQRELQTLRAEVDARNAQIQQQLQEKDSEIRELKTELQEVRESNKEQEASTGQCQRPECIKLRKEKRLKEVWLMGNPGKEMDRWRVADHDQLVHEFEKLTTDPDGLLGVLEGAMREHGDDAIFEARKLLSALFQESYDSCKKAVIDAIYAELESLFVVQPMRAEKMEDASQGYGLLLHAFGLRTEKMREQYFTNIKAKICSKILSNETLQNVKGSLESSHEDHLREVIKVAWKFVTFPKPFIVCQPKSFNFQIHSKEFGHWDKQADELELIYTRPVVYRNYEGVVASKGWVASKVS